MKTTTRLLLIACLSLAALAACKKEEAPVATEKAALTAPASADDEKAWEAYVVDVVQRRVDEYNLNTNPYVYFLPPESKPTFADDYARLLEKASVDVQRGITGGNMLAFAGPSSTKAGDLAVGAFEKAQPGSLKDVRVVFIGAQTDSDRVKAAVEPSGATYSFVEAK